MHVIVSTSGIWQIYEYLHNRNFVLLTPLCSECTIVGMPLGSFDCLARSKSDNIMCPDWCSRMSGRRQLKHARMI